MILGTTRTCWCRHFFKSLPVWSYITMPLNHGCKIMSNVCSHIYPFSKYRQVFFCVDKKNQLDVTFVFFISLLIVAQHVSGNHVPIISSWRLRDVIALCWYVTWLHQLDVTFCILYFSSTSCSKCFGQPCAHHQ